MAMTLQHAPKALVFGAAGFVFSEWLPLIAAMICSGALGTWVGLRLLQRMEEALFARVFKWLLTLLALLMVLLPEEWREPVTGTLVFLLGGMAFSIYPLSLSHAWWHKNTAQH